MGLLQRSFKSPSSGRRRRYIEAGKLYELGMRTKFGIPFPAIPDLQNQIKGIMARAQSMTGITICAYIVMGNHIHLISYVECPESFIKFYAILAKSLTDLIKKKLGLKQLNLWEPRPMVAQILDYEAACRRFAYLFSNPSRANLVSDIDQFPGANSFASFKSASSVNSALAESCTWTFPRRLKSEPDDGSPQKTHRISISLAVSPLIWLPVFNKNNPSDTARKIISMVRTQEEKDFIRLKGANRVAFGASFLIKEQITLDYQPKKYSRRLFYMSCDAEVAAKYRAKVAKAELLAKSLYRNRFRHGLPVEWPAAIVPPRGPMSYVTPSWNSRQKKLLSRE